jgi:hypothetical protein
MTIEETRKKLKLDNTYCDEQVQEIIDFTESLAGIFIDQNKENLKKISLQVRKELKLIGYSNNEITEYIVLKNIASEKRNVVF